MFFGKQFQCHCIAWNSRGDAKSRSASVEVASKMILFKILDVYSSCMHREIFLVLEINLYFCDLRLTRAGIIDIISHVNFNKFDLDPLMELLTTF